MRTHAEIAGVVSWLGGSQDLAAVLQGIAHAAVTVLGATRASCYAYDVATQVVSVVVTTETDPGRKAFLEGAVGLGAARLPIWRLQVDQDDPILTIDDVANDPRLPAALAARLGSGAILGVRLEHPSIQVSGAPALLGTLFCTYPTPRVFSEADREAAGGLAGLATLSVANAYLQDETMQRIEDNRALAAEQAALRRVATQVAAEVAPGQVFGQAAHEVAGLLGVECGLVVRFEPEQAVPVGWWGAHQCSLDATFPLDGVGALAQVARTGRAARIGDYRPLGGDSAGRIARAGGYRSAVAAPVCVAGRLWGALLAATTRDIELPAESEERLERFAELVALGIANAEAQARLIAQAATDPLTGLANHRTFFERLHAETRRAERHGHHLGLVVIDLDHFKRVNDEHGHLVGDAVLIEMASRLSGLARAEDTIARVGGEEFAWLLPGCDTQAAWAAGERARRIVAGTPFPEVGRVTLSAGVSELAAGANVNELFRTADAALYWAKSQGRDVCVPYSSHDHPDAPKRLGGASRIAPSVGRLLALAREQVGLPLVAVGQFQAGEQVWRYLDGDGGGFGITLGGTVPIEETYCKRLAEGRIPNLIRDARRDASVRELPITDKAGVGAYVGAPITLEDGSIYGVLCCLGARAEPALGPHDVSLVRVLAEMVGVEIEREDRGAAAEHESVERIHRVLDSGCFEVVFQPIVELTGGGVVAVEALSRFTEEPRRSPDIWFAEAASVNLGLDLELAAIRAAFARIDEIPPGLRLSVNVSPATICAPQFAELMALVPGDRVAIELTEHAPVEDYAVLEAALRAPRERGAQLMIDDVGSGFSSLKHIIGLRPDVIKLDLALTRDIDTDPVRRALAASLVAFVGEIHAAIVAEGIETAAELEALRALGITHGQGYYLGRPQPGPIPARVELAALSLNPSNLAARDARSTVAMRDSSRSEGSPCGCAPNPA